MEALRELAYPKTHVMLLCYNTSQPISLANAQTTWQEELRTKAAKCAITENAPCILVGTMVATPQPHAPSLPHLSTLAAFRATGEMRWYRMVSLLMSM